MYDDGYDDFDDSESDMDVDDVTDNDNMDENDNDYASNFDLGDIEEKSDSDDDSTGRADDIYADEELYDSTDDFDISDEANDAFEDIDEDEIDDCSDDMDSDDTADDDTDEVSDINEVSEEIIADVTEQEIIDATEQAYRDLGLSDNVIEALMTPATERSWRQTELVDEIRHIDYETQRSYVYDELRNYKESNHGVEGSQRPDLIRFSEEGIDIREDKSYHNANALIQNIHKQAAERFELFGDELNDLTFVVAANEFTLKDADRISQAAYETGSDIEWILK